MAPVFQPPKMGAYTELWAALSLDLKGGDGQKFIISWGRWNTTPEKEHLDSLKTRGEGGTKLATDFYDYCELYTKEVAALQLWFRAISWMLELRLSGLAVTHDICTAARRVLAPSS